MQPPVNLVGAQANALSGPVAGVAGPARGHNPIKPPPTWGAGGGNVCYDNGNVDPLTDSGNEFSQWCQADDFELAAAETVTGASIDWFDLNFGNQWDGGIMWTFHNDAGGLPGSVVAAGTGTEVSSTLISTNGGWDWWTTEFTLDGGGVALAANTRYWLSMHWAGDTDYNRDEVYFAYSDQQNFNITAEDNNCVGAWAQFAEDRGFRLLCGGGCDIIYDNGTVDPLTDSGNEFSQWCQADDFELQADTDLCGAEIDWFDLNFGNQWDGGIMWTIHNDAGGLPGSVVDTGTGIENSTTLISTNGGWDWWITDFDFDHTVAVSGGTRYWLSMHWAGDTDYVRDEVYFAYSDQQNFNITAEDNNCVGAWAQFAEDRGFRLKGGGAGGPSCDIVKYCNPGDGNLGNVATISASGCDLTLAETIDAAGVPTNQNGYLIVGDQNVNGGMPNLGNICITGGCTGRYIGDVQNSGGGGTYSTDISNSITGGPNYGLVGSCSGQIDAGETFYFQYWHRTPATPGCGNTTLYDNGNVDPLTDSGNEMSRWCEADDFELSANATVGGASIDWFDLNFGNQWDGGIMWTIHNDAGGQPGGVVASGTGTECSSTLISTNGGWDWWVTEFAFDGGGVALNGNTRYWLSLHWAADTDYIRDEVYWAYSDQQAFGPTHEDLMCSGGWFASTAEDRGFRLLDEGAPGSPNHTFSEAICVTFH